MPTVPEIPLRSLHTLATHAGPINTLTFSHDGGTYVLTGSSDRQIHLSRTEPTSKHSTNETTDSVVVTREPIQRYTSHGYAVLDISVTTDNTKFVSSSADRSGPFFWDINVSDSTLRRFGSNSPAPHTSRITCVSFTAQDSVLVSGSDDRSVRMWDVKSRDARPLMVLEDAKDGVTSLVCRDYEVIAGSSDARVRSYDIRMGKCLVDVQPGVVTSLCLGRDGRTFLVGCLDGRMRIMDRENGTCLRTLPGNLDGKSGGEKERYVNESLRLQSCFGIDEKAVLSGSEADGKVRAWDVLTGKMIGSVNVSEAGKVVSVVKWREGSEVLGQERRGIWAAGGVDGMVRVYG